MSQRQLWVVRQFCRVVFTIACFSGIAGAQLADTRMGLVAPGVGWVVQNQGTPVIRNDHLSWTTDDGGTWKDITPADPASKQIAGVFFLDASRGWVLLALKHEWSKNPQEPDNFITDVRGFDLASTTDGGATWTMKHLDALAEGVGWLAASEIFFLDATHGWMNIESPVPHWGGEGILLATIDGGNTWKPIVEVNGGGGYGAMRFTDPKNGWIAGGPGDNYLYRTSDGGRHWREVVVPPHTPISERFENVAALYTLPKFNDAMHGILPVKYSGPGKSGEDVSIQALLSTNDGGISWHLESWSNLDQAADFPIVAVVDSTVIAPKRVGGELPSLVKLGPGGELTETRASEAPSMPNGAALSNIAFTDAEHGWASSSNNRLLSTSNSGQSWKDITPGRKATSLRPLSSPASGGNSSDVVLQGDLAFLAASGPIAAASTNSTYKSRHIGFDLCQAPGTGPMATWWASSPYFDIGIYVGGSTRSCPQPNLTSSWVKTVTTQGWGLISLWSGPQAPCTCAPSTPPGTWPNCTKNWAITISTTGGAYAQGQAEADAATSGSKSAMQKLGLGAGSAIYVDIENYNPSATCNGSPTGSYVNSFLSGWVGEIQHNGYIAGVYGNPAPASTWSVGGTGFGAVSPSPNDVFIAKQDNRVTIWGLTGLADAAWPQDQRIHQWGAPHDETWATQKLNIDSDIEDADVTGGNGAKSYSFSYTLIDEYGVGRTTPIGINNSGQIVGQYADSTTTHGFVDSSGVLVSIDFPFATTTQAYGINNNGEVVGFYSDQQFHEHGFLYQAGSYTSFDAPGATQTFAFGINDDDQISGYYIDSLGVHHGFQYQAGAGTFTSIDYPGASGTETYGINGDAQIAGGCPGLDCPPFLYAQGVFSYPPVGSDALNNNDQINGGNGGTRVFEHEGISVTIAPPGASMTNPLYSPSDFLLNSQTTAKVALVGSCVINGVFHGFLATSQ